jgi:hypothetical protein
MGAPGLDGLDGDPDFPIPGPTGPQGPAGSAGATGPVGLAGAPGLDGIDGDPDFPIPGPQGPTGAQGSIGPTGAIGSTIWIPGIIDDSAGDALLDFSGPPTVSLPQRIYNVSVASQAPAAATRTYLTGSALKVPSGKLAIGNMFLWRFNMTKTGAGTALSTFDIAFGTAGSTADTARVSFVKPAGTGVIDEAWVEIMATIRGPITSLCIVSGLFHLSHNLAATGHAIIPNVVVNTQSAGFDVTGANIIAGICLTSGALDAITIQLMQAEAFNL